MAGASRSDDARRMATTQSGALLLKAPEQGGGLVLPTPDPATSARSRGFHVQGMPVRRWLGTTPGRLRVGSVLAVAALALVGLVGVVATAARRDATHTVGKDATPALVAAQGLFAVLADADAAMLSGYLDPSLDSTELRERYELDIERAGRFLALLGSSGGAPEVRSAVATIAHELPSYAADVEASRAEARTGHSVSSSYLRLASKTMREDILPQATVLYEHAAAQLDEAYDMGTSSTQVVWLVGSALVALGLLLAVQWRLFARTHRIVSLPVAAATLALVFMVAAVAVVWSAQQRNLHDAQRTGSDAVQVLAATRVLALRAASDDILTLIEQGGGTNYASEYDALSARIAGDRRHDGLLDTARTIAARTDSTQRIERIAAQWADVATVHAALTAKYDDAQYGEALDIARDDKRPAVEKLDRGLGNEIAAARVELDGHASDATSGLDVLLLVIPVLTVGGIVLVLVGVQRRIVEYR